MTKYYILSLSHSPVGNCALWWRPDDKGYTTNLREAGLYTHRQVVEHADLYDNGEETRAVPQRQVMPMTESHVDFCRIRNVAKPALKR